MLYHATAFPAKFLFKFFLRANALVVNRGTATFGSGLEQKKPATTKALRHSNTPEDADNTTST